MSLVSGFVNKSLSVFRLGNSWFSGLVSSIIEAGRTNSYIETVCPSKSDTLHKEVKWSDGPVLKREFERAVRKALECLRFGRVKVAIDCTEEPYWGENGIYNTRAAVHELSEESWQFVNLSIVEPKFVPLMSLPYRQIDDLDSLVIDLLEYLRTLPLRVGLVLFDRGFYHWELIDYLNNRKGGRPWPYLIFVPKNDAIKDYIEKTSGRLGVFIHEGSHSKEKSKWKTRTKIVICKGIGKDKNGNLIDWCFATNQRASLNLVWTYRKRWNIETGFRVQDEATIKSKSSHPLIRFFYHLISMIIILMWRIYNKINGHIVFKRFLKFIEYRHAAGLAIDPPPNPVGIGWVHSDSYVRYMEVRVNRVGVTG
jgi:hypothetical protein